MYAKDISDSCETAWINKKVYKNNIYLNKEFLSKIESRSIDVSVLEKKKTSG